MRAKTAGLTALAMLAFASNSLLCRAALGRELSDAASFSVLRIAAGALSLAWLAGRARRTGSVRDAGWASAFALFAYAIGFSLAYVRIPAGTGALLLFAAVQITMIGHGVASGQRPSPREWLGMLVSLVGLVALTRPGLSRPDPAGSLLMLGAGVAWGVYSLRGRATGDPLRSNAVNFARAVPLVILAGAVALALGDVRLTPSGAGLAIASGALASGIGYVLWYAALRGLSATQGAVVQLSVPPLAAAGGVLLLGEALTLRLVLAGVAILGGIALAVTGRA